jgi:hypothetical protein
MDLVKLAATLLLMTPATPDERARVTRRRTDDMNLEDYERLAPCRTGEFQGRDMTFFTPNGATLWRVESLFSKEPDTIEWIGGFAEGDTLLDIGANVGMYSIFAARTRGARVFAFEPESQNYAILNRNIHLTGFEARQRHCAACPTSPGSRSSPQLFIGGSCRSYGAPLDHDNQPVVGTSRRAASRPPSTTSSRPGDAGACAHPDRRRRAGAQGRRRGASDARRPGVRSVLVRSTPRSRSIGRSWTPARQVRLRPRPGGPLGAPRRFKSRQHVFRRWSPSTTGSPIRRSSSARSHFYATDVFPADFMRSCAGGRAVRLHADRRDRDRQACTRDASSARSTSSRGAVQSSAGASGPTSGWLLGDAFSRLILDRFRPSLRERFGPDNDPRIETDARLVRDFTNYAISPHTDSPRKVVSLLFYLPQDDAKRHLGTSIYAPTNPDFRWVRAPATIRSSCSRRWRRWSTGRTRCSRSSRPSARSTASIRSPTPKWCATLLLQHLRDQGRHQPPPRRSPEARLRVAVAEVAGRAGDAGLTSRGRNRPTDRDRPIYRE